MSPTSPVDTDIVLVGGGHSHLAVLKDFGMVPEPGKRLTLITRELSTWYSGMIPGMIAGHYSPSEAQIDLTKLARFANARLYHGTATHIDVNNQTVHMTGRPPIPYDFLSLDIGSKPDLKSIEGSSKHAISIRPLDEFLLQWREIEESLIGSDSKINIVIVGAGAGGVELSLALNYKLRKQQHYNRDRLSIKIVTESPHLLSDHPESVRKRLRSKLSIQGIQFHTKTQINHVSSTEVFSADGRRFDADVTIIVTTGVAPSWLENCGVSLDKKGFVRVNSNLCSISHKNIFATGDVAHFEKHPLPKSGVYAVRQGPYLSENLRRASTGRPLRSYRPQNKTLALISTGDKHAIASYTNFSIAGAPVWQIKDRIDRRWIRKYQILPDMADSTGSTIDQDHPLNMRCGGCGAKVAGPILRRVLERLDIHFGKDILMGIDARDDAAVIAPPRNKVLVQSVDQFRTFIDDPLLFGRITANHALSDIHAMGAKATSAQALVTLAYASESKIETDLYEMLTGALQTFNESGVILAGGHTAEGAETALGFAVNGFAYENDLLKKEGLKVGDILILTKALGTGAIFAANMRAKASSYSVNAATQSMLLSNWPAVDILRRFGAISCTDITGFGLSGHLIEMLNASSLAAELSIKDIPTISGATDLISEGLTSTLQKANESFAISCLNVNLDDPSHRMIFDPQTAGGLIAGISIENANNCLAALKAGPAPNAEIVGRVVESNKYPLKIMW